MFSIISFDNVRMSGMGKNLITSYAALGVGLAVVLTFGLTAISSVMEQPSQSQFTVSDPDLNLRAKIQEGSEVERKSLETPVPAVPSQSSEPSEAQEGASTEADVPATPPTAPETQNYGSTQAGAPSDTSGGDEGASEVPMEKMPAQEETSRENYVITAEAPAASSSFAGILMVLPYIAAAAVGSAVFAVTRKRVGW